MLCDKSVISEIFAAIFLGLQQFSSSLKNLSVFLWWLLISNKCRRGEPEISSLTPLLTLPPSYTLTSATSVGWGHLSWSWPPGALGLPSTEGYFLILPFSIPVLWLNFQMPPTLAASFFLPESFPSNLPWAFPNCSPHLCPPSSDPESTNLRNAACAELRELWGLPLPIRLCLRTDGWVNGAVGEIFIFKPGSFVPVPCGPLLFPDLEG